MQVCHKRTGKASFDFFQDLIMIVLEPNSQQAARDQAQVQKKADKGRSKLEWAFCALSQQLQLQRKQSDKNRCSNEAALKNEPRSLSA